MLTHIPWVVQGKQNLPPGSGIPVIENSWNYVMNSIQVFQDAQAPLVHKPAYFVCFVESLGHLFPGPVSQSLSIFSKIAQPLRLSGFLVLLCSRIEVWNLNLNEICAVHTDLEGLIVSKKSPLRQNGLQPYRKRLKFIVRYSPSTLQMFTGNYRGHAGKICNIYGKGL